MDYTHTLPATLKFPRELIIIFKKILLLLISVVLLTNCLPDNGKTWKSSYRGVDEKAIRFASSYCVENQNYRHYTTWGESDERYEVKRFKKFNLPGIKAAISLNRVESSLRVAIFEVDIQTNIPRPRSKVDSKVKELIRTDIGKISACISSAIRTERERQKSKGVTHKPQEDGDRAFIAAF